MEEAQARAVRLNPFAVQNELRNGTFAGVGDYFLGSARLAFDIDFFVGDGVLGQKTLRFTAIAAPVGGVDEKFHRTIVSHLWKACCQGRLCNASNRWVFRPLR